MKALSKTILVICLLVPLLTCSKDGFDKTYIGCEINGEKYWNEGERACILGISTEGSYIRVRDHVEEVPKSLFHGTEFYYVQIIGKGDKQAYPVHFVIKWNYNNEIKGKRIPLQLIDNFPDQSADNAYIAVGDYKPVSGYIVIDSFIMEENATWIKVSFEYDGKDSSNNTVMIRNGCFYGRGPSILHKDKEYGSLYEKYYGGHFPE